VISDRSPQVVLDSRELGYIVCARDGWAKRGLPIVVLANEQYPLHPLKLHSSIARVCMAVVSVKRCPDPTTIELIHEWSEEGVPVTVFFDGHLACAKTGTTGQNRLCCMGGPKCTALVLFAGQPVIPDEVAHRYRFVKVVPLAFSGGYQAIVHEAVSVLIAASATLHQTSPLEFLTTAVA